MTTEKHPVIIIDTSHGCITARLHPDVAPVTVQSFLRYVDERFYDGTIFHRVIDGFMIQGGGLTPDMKAKGTHNPLPNEASTDLPNRAGTLAMARTSDPHSATAQFFINLVDNDFLNHRAPTAEGYGYCVFGEVTEHFDVVQTIGGVETTRVGRYEDVPAEPVTVNSIRRAT